MTTMDMTMSNLDSRVNLQGNDPKVPANTKIKRDGIFDATYIKPLSIVGAVILLGLIIVIFKAVTPEQTIQTVDGGVVTDLELNKDNIGRDELNEQQVKYLSQKDLALAENNAGDGTSSAAIVNRARVGTALTGYDATGASDASAITAEYQSIPKTVAQLDAENLAANKTLYSKGADAQGYVIYTSKRNGQIIQPVDRQLAEGFSPNTNATYATNDNYNGGANNNGNYSNNNSNSGGNDGGSQANAGGQDQNQSREPDPVIEAKRQQLSADFEAYQATLAEIDAKEKELQQIQQQRYQGLQQTRNQAASQSLSNSLNSVQQSVGGNQGYTPMSYTNPQQNQRQGQSQNNQNNQNPQYGNGQYNQNPQNNSYGNGQYNQNPQNNQFGGGQSQFDQNQNMSNNPVPYQNDQGAGYQPQGSQNNYLNNVSANSNQPLMLNNSGNTGVNVGLGNQGSNRQAYSGNYNQGVSTGEIVDARLPKNVIRAGTKWQVVITKPVNTDEGLQVVGEIVGGKFSGSTIYGMVQQSGRNIGVQFNTIAQPNSRKPLMPIMAYATTLGTQKTAVSKDVNNHYVQNYGIKGLTAILRGYGEAYENSGENVIITDNGTVITTTDSKPSSDKIRGEVLGELGKDLTADIGKLGNRAPTYKIPMGTVVNVVLSNDLDVNGISSSIIN